MRLNRQTFCALTSQIQRCLLTGARPGRFHIKMHLCLFIGWQVGNVHCNFPRMLQVSIILPPKDESQIEGQARQHVHSTNAVCCGNVGSSQRLLQLAPPQCVRACAGECLISRCPRYVSLVDQHRSKPQSEKTELFVLITLQERIPTFLTSHCRSCMPTQAWKRVDSKRVPKKPRPRPGPLLGKSETIMVRNAPSDADM